MSMTVAEMQAKCLAACTEDMNEIQAGLAKAILQDLAIGQRITFSEWHKNEMGTAEQFVAAYAAGCKAFVMVIEFFDTLNDQQQDDVIQESVKKMM